VRTQRHRRADLDARLLLPRLQILDIDRCTGLQIGNSLETRNIEQDAARENPVLEIMNRILLMPAFQDGNPRSGL